METELVATDISISSPSLSEVLLRHEQAIVALYQSACQYSLNFGASLNERDMSHWFIGSPPIEVSSYKSDYFKGIFPSYLGDTFYRGYLVSHPELWECAVVFYQPFLPSPLSTQVFPAALPAVAFLGDPPTAWVEMILQEFITHETVAINSLENDPRVKLSRRLDVYHGARIKK